MTPEKIFNVMDLARRCRKLNRTFNPLFVGPPGVGKSEIVQQWCNKNGLPFVDVRIAYKEAPDMVGFPIVTVVDGRQTTVFATPEQWPQDPNWEGVILFEEPNRGTTSVMNTMMQVLTDRCIDKYKLPKGAIIASCINPDSTDYDVNAMDPALRNRFEIFEVEYDKKTHVSYMKKTDYVPEVVSFIESGAWSFVTPEKVGNAVGSKYISPRTFSKLDNAIHAFVEEEDEMFVFEAILGKNVGKAFYAWKNNEQPVMYSDLMANPAAALGKLRSFSDPKNYKNAQISITLKDILEDGSIADDLLAKVAMALPADQGPALIKNLEFKRNDLTLLSRLYDAHPELHKYFKEVLKRSKKSSEKEEKSK